MLNKTPRSERFHIGIFGKTNSGKSSLLNAITAQQVAIVSDVKGTTTDPIEKRFELLAASPVVFIDTAGFGDFSVLGKKREETTNKVLNRVDLALILLSVDDMDYEWFKSMVRECKKLSIPYMMIISKTDLAEDLELLKNTYPDANFISVNEGIDDFVQVLTAFVQSTQDSRPLLGDVLSYGSRVLLVVPIDSEAPKGRIIHPQVQVIRECLDHGIEVIVVRDTELEATCKRLNYQIDLVITDSQAFDFVSKIIPENMLLTSFSIVFARYKGELDCFIEGLKALDNIKPQDKICIAESCSHNISCEDIGRYKIPNALKKRLGFEPNIDFFMGNDFPKNPLEYSLIIHCGACMTNRKEVINRIQRSHDTHITNYGVFLAYMAGLFPRAVKVFERPSS